MDARTQVYLAKVALEGISATPKWAFASIREQRLWVYDGERLVAEFAVSTSVAPPSCAYSSGGTPLGLHAIAEKIGADAGWGTIFVKREPVGVFDRAAPDPKALITSRILWLKGLEENKNSGYACGSYNRKIYIHGTNLEDKIGTPASQGCIELANDNVIALFELLDVGSHVLID